MILPQVAGLMALLFMTNWAFYTGKKELCSSKFFSKGTELATKMSLNKKTGLIVKASYCSTLMTAKKRHQKTKIKGLKGRKLSLTLKSINNENK